MAKTYLSLVNDLLVEINEPELSSVANAVGVQKQVSKCVNRAYFDIVDAVDNWAWLATNTPQNEYYGNTFVETVAGTRWYLLKAGSSSVDTDYDAVDWDRFTATTEGVSGKSAPHTINKLGFVTLDVWRNNYARSEELDKSSSSPAYGVPLRVIRSSDGRRFGLSPIPDDVYRIYFNAYNRPSELSNDTDEVLFPEQYKPVLLARARYFIYQFKDNIAQSQLALDEYKKGLQQMSDKLNSPQPKYMSDVRFTYLLP
ncbi:hypothetical protein HTVC103P_gp73 [Pelagibacter phage HTVC103P]|nr:hypothetical protein HTVC103P_gp73 [Pelagibacter phage HTVC103P]